MTDKRHKPERVVESIKSSLRKYLKRERRKDLPKGADYWDFDCSVGQSKESAKTVHLAELIPAVDTAAGESWPEIYIEILAKTGHRTQKPKASDTNEQPALSEDTNEPPQDQVEQN